MKKVEYIPPALKLDSHEIQNVVYVAAEIEKTESGIKLVPWAGPIPSTLELLQTIGRSEQSCIIKCEIIWWWKKDRWIEV